MKIIVTEPSRMADQVRASLKGLGTVAYGPFDDASLAAELADCEALVVRLGRYIGPEILDHAPRLRFLVTATTGLDHIDLAAATTRGIRVISLRDCPGAIRDVSATAELTWGLLLALLRKIPAATMHTTDGSWNRDLFVGTQLRGKRLGIVGLGRIGAMVARYALAFGMEVLAHDTDPARIAAPAIRATLDEIARSCDAISIHVAATPENRRLIDHAFLARMKPTAVLVNTARGSVVDEAALADAIASGRIAGAAVDVLQGEEHGQTTSSPLLACARRGGNVLITPHIGGATIESLAQAEGAVVEVLKAEFAAGAPRIQSG
jgi:D-3-phosphoglycerate dehydrogenase